MVFTWLSSYINHMSSHSDIFVLVLRVYITILLVGIFLNRFGARSQQESGRSGIPTPGGEWFCVTHGFGEEINSSLRVKTSDTSGDFGPSEVKNHPLLRGKSFICPKFCKPSCASLWSAVSQVSRTLEE